MYAATAALAAFLLAGAPALAESQIPTLTANGIGTVSVVPDIAIVMIGVNTRAPTAREALDLNTADLERTIAAIRAEDVGDKDIGTSGFSVSPVYEDRPPRPLDQPGTEPEAPRIVGYQVFNNVRVVIRDLEKSGGILDKVVTAGANQVNGIEFDVSDPKTPSDEALRRAIADAKATAELMAEAAGVRLVRMISVTATGTGAPMFVDGMARMAMKAVPVMPGEREITANAMIAWEIAPK